MALASLRVNMVAQTTRFNAGMRAAQRQTQMFVGTVRAAKSAILGLASAALTYAGLAGLKSLVKESMKTIDATAKLSDRIGVSTETLTGLGYAAELSGVSMEAMNKSLEMFVRRIGESTEGTGEAKRAMDALGITAEYFKGLSTEEAFFKIADAIKNTEDTSRKALLAYGFFGRQGQQLLNLFEQGTDATKEQIRQAIELGAAYNRIDAAKVEEANNALLTMSYAWKGIGNTLAIVVAPYIQEAANGMAAFVGHTEKLKKMETIMQGLARFGGFLLEAFNAIRAVINTTVGITQKYLAYVTRFVSIQLKVVQEIAGALGIDLPDFSGFMKDLSKDFSEAGGANLAQAAEQFLDIGHISAKVEKAIERIGNAKDNIIKSITAPLVSSLKIQPAFATPSNKPARFGEYRSRFTEFGGLTIGPDPILNEMKKQTQILESINDELEESNSKETLE